MTGEFSLPVTSMNGMWTIKTKYIQIGSASFTGNNASVNIQFVPDTVDGYKPVGIIGYSTTNSNENGVVPKDSSGKSYQGNTWLSIIQAYYNMNRNIGVIGVRNYSNTGSTSTINREGGGYVMCFVVVYMLYLKAEGGYIPSTTDMVDTSTDVSLNYGLKADVIATYGRVCQILVTGTTSQAVSADSILGSVPKPIVVTNAPNLSGSSYLYDDGTLRTSGALASGATVNCTLTYITA